MNYLSDWTVTDLVDTGAFCAIFDWWRFSLIDRVKRIPPTRALRNHSKIIETIPESIENIISVDHSHSFHCQWVDSIPTQAHSSFVSLSIRFNWTFQHDVGYASILRAALSDVWFRVQCFLVVSSITFKSRCAPEEFGDFEHLHSVLALLIVASLARRVWWCNGQCIR